MHVSACILLLPPLTIAPLAFQFVYVCICTYIMYLYVYEVYARIVFVYACISCNHTSRHGKRCHVHEALSHGAAIGGPHSGHPWGCGHPLFFRTWQMLLRPDLAHPTRCTRLGPLKRPCHWPLGGLQCTNRALPSSLGTCHIRSGRLKPIQTPQGAGHRPSKTQPYCNSSMSVYVCMSVYVGIYVCIYNLAYVNVHICLYMYVYACICVYARIYIYKGHIHQK